MKVVAVQFSQPRAVSASNLRRWLRRAVDRHAVGALRVSIGIIFVWFGLLKFFPGSSPAEPLALATLDVLTRGVVPQRVELLMLAGFESCIGLCFLLGVFAQGSLLLLCCHMLGTALPFLLFPAQLFVRFPFIPSFEGQYIMKNLIIVCAALTVRAPWLRQVARRRARRQDRRMTPCVVA